MTAIKIVPLSESLLPAAVNLFVERLKDLRHNIPILPAKFEDPQKVTNALRQLINAGPSAAALLDGELVGYMGSFLIDHFRETDLRGAYCPEWGHMVTGNDRSRVVTALYRELSAQWTGSGCRLHALSMLANDPELQRIWFWNGFGMAVVDAVRSMDLLETPVSTPLTIRRAQTSDAPVLAMLDEEHWRHYTNPPVFMVSQDSASVQEMSAFLNNPQNSIWLAIDHGEPVGFIRFEGSSEGAADIVQSVETVAITGAYVRPAHRGQRAAPAMLQAALAYHRGLGCQVCSVDFESFNPEAASFWMRFFTPVCFSLIRRPESM